MKTLTAILFALALSGCASLRETAHTAVAADALTTGAGIMLGAGTEVNPLITSIPMGLATVGLRVAAVEIANRQDEPTRTTALAATNAVTWGVVSNNLYVIAAKYVKGLAVLGSYAPHFLGLGFGYLVWEATSEKREMARLCAMHKETHPNIKC